MLLVIVFVRWGAIIDKLSSLRLRNYNGRGLGN